MENLIWIVIVGTSIWVLVDAKSIGVKKGQIKGMGNIGPWGWFFVCLLLWIVGFPFYLAKRSEYKKINSTHDTEQQMKEIKLDCNACKTDKTMKATTIPKFSGFIRFIGFLIAIPSVLGVLFAILMLFSTGSATNEVMSSAQSDAEAAGAAIGATIGFGFAAFIGFSSLIGGLIGWLLLMKKKVFKCIKCGYIMDRG